MPHGLIWSWITGLLSLGLLGSGIYFIWAWEERVLIGDEYLWLGVALLALTVLGRPIAALVLGRPARRDEEEPRMERGGTPIRLPRPDGTELFVESYGPENAPTLLLTHGWGMNGTEWFYAKRQLAGRFRLLIWDLPGLGDSKRPPSKNFELERMAQDLEAVLTLAGNQPVILCGHSIGGMITLTFCRLFPEHVARRIAGIILTHTTYTNPVNTAKGARILRVLQKPLIQPLCYITIALSPLMRLMNLLSYANGLMHLSVHLTHFGRKETRGQLEFSVRFALLASPSVVARGMLAMMRYDATAALPTIPVPALVVAANRDQATVPEASQRIAEAIPRSEIITLLPAGHLGLVEKHEEWVAHVRAFSERCCDKREQRTVAV